MFRFFETIKIIDGVVQFPEWHQNRIAQTIHSHGLKKLCLESMQTFSVPDKYQKGVVKCRLEYDENGYSVEFSNYMMKNIATLKLIHCDEINYKYKFSDRSDFEKLFKLKGDCDDIIIVKNGKITDTSFSNIIFYDGLTWVTPDEPLLNGTCRQRMLLSHLIIEKPIFATDLYKFEKVVLINAMRGEQLENPVLISCIK